MKFERVLEFIYGDHASAQIDYFRDKHELYVHCFIRGGGDFPEKHTILFRLTDCVYFAALSDSELRLGGNESFANGLYRAVGIGKEFDFDELDFLPENGTVYAFNTTTDFLYLAVASSHEVLRTWPPDKPR